MGVKDSDITILQTGIPTTQNVTPENAADLWAKHK
jgi:hypothetical protein